MKKLAMLFVMLVVLGTSVPAYCQPVRDYILVYKLTISGKVVNTWEDEIVSAKIQGYWVVSIDETIDGVEITDSRLVIFGKKDGEKLYGRVDTLSWDMLLVGYPDVDIAVVTMGLPSCDLIIHGKLKATNIGLAEKEWIPSSFTGGALFDGSFFGLANIMGSGTISAKLDSKLTKANVLGGSAYDVLETIITNQLIAKDYEEL